MTNTWMQMMINQMRMNLKLNKALNFMKIIKIKAISLQLVSRKVFSRKSFEETLKISNR